MLRVLLVAPEPDDTAPYIPFLEPQGITTFYAPSDSNTEQLCKICLGRPPDLVIMDLRKSFDALPLRAFRRRLTDAWNHDTSNIPPILTLLGPRQVMARDWLPLTEDFLAPPHTPDELAVRVRLLLFRRRQIENGETICFQDVVLDLSGGIVRHVLTQNTISLTPREWDLLLFLLTHRGKLYSRERLLDFVWGVDYAGGPRTVDIHIRRLRAKLPPNASASLENRRGLGYGFVTPATP